MADSLRKPTLVQFGVMAALVATILYFPFGIAIAIGMGLAGVPFHGFVTFGGAFNNFVGAMTWWLVVFAASCIYTAYFFPWDDKVFGWPKKR